MCLPFKTSKLPGAFGSLQMPFIYSVALYGIYSALQSSIWHLPLLQSNIWDLPLLQSNIWDLLGLYNSLLATGLLLLPWLHSTMLFESFFLMDWANIEQLMHCSSMSCAHRQGNSFRSVVYVSRGRWRSIVLHLTFLLFLIRSWSSPLYTDVNLRVRRPRSNLEKLIGKFFKYGEWPEVFSSPPLY